jgi:hypothetical protein
MFYKLKLSLLLIVNVALAHCLYGQVLDYISLGYNTVEITTERGSIFDKITDRRSFSEHYFLKDERFSKMAYGRGGYDLLKADYDESFRMADDGSCYEGGIHYTYKMQDGKLVSAEIGFDAGYDEWDLFYDESKKRSGKVEYSSAGLTVYFETEVYKFYNIPENELYDRFMYRLADDYQNVINYNNRHGNQIHRLENITKFELELFKNCILAKYKYVFQQEFWNAFMKKYYYGSDPHSPPRYMSFTGEERKLLQMIQKRNGEEDQVRYVNSPEGLNMRYAPDRSSEKKITIPHGSPVSIITAAPNRVRIDGIENNWYYVKYNDRYGWVFGGYLVEK